MGKFKEFDIFVIGTGAAGKSVANNCAEAGLKVAIADNREFGGTCANRGCDPKKVLIGLTEIIDRAEKMKGKGIAEMPKFSWEDLMAYKDTFVNGVPAATENALEKAGIELYHQSPKFLDKDTLSVEGKTVKAKKIVIATGQKPLELKIPGREYPINSDDFLELKQLPESMIFIGAGYIGMEFAHLAARFGVKVTIIEFAPRALTNFDEELVKFLQEASEVLGIKFIFNSEVVRIEKLSKNFRVIANQKGKTISIDAAIVVNAAGRIPSIDDLDLEIGKVEFSKKGISVNQYLQSITNKKVYACGDASNSKGLALSPLTSLEARIVSANLLHPNEPEKVEYPPQASAVFTLPNLAMVGFLEEEAKEQGLDFTIKQNKMPTWFNAKRINESFYAFKTLVDNKTGLILGAHLLGPEASEVINLFSLAMSEKIPAKNLKNLIFTYPAWGNDIKGMV